MIPALVVTVCVLALSVVLLTIKVLSVKCGLRSIREQLPDIVRGGSNKLLTFSCGGDETRKLAAELNARLAEVRAKELKYDNGDREIKTALTNAAHDLRTPLTAICGYLDLLEGESDLGERERYLSVIRERTETLAALSEELFAYSVAADRRAARAAERLDAGDVLKECLADFYEGFRAKNITPEINVPVPSFTVTADKTELVRMFSNIISNALKYSAGGFKVCLDGEKIVFGNHVDNIDAVDVNRLFDRFYTVRNGKTSTGLGLSIAKLICERLGGSISAALDGSVLEIILDFQT